LSLIQKGVKLVLFGGAGVGKTVLIMELNQQHRESDTQVYLCLLVWVKEHVKETIY
jgi:F0F1-type ATP synthase beta subunit